jgi:hypothetical protein
MALGIFISERESIPSSNFSASKKQNEKRKNSQAVSDISTTQNTLEGNSQ